MFERYERFQIDRPEFLADHHWASIDIEAQRLERCLADGDHGQALSDIKCLVEAIAKVTLDVDGNPADPNTSFDALVNRAHILLAHQPGRDIVNESPFGQMATQASKIARNLGAVRNDWGGGHGRAHVPEVVGEMVHLALDGGFIWSRWALRRLGHFSEGRPSALIRDLIDDPQTFYAGTLRRRLEAANLSALDPRHQRSLGVAVGQRSSRGTFVVTWDGVDACANSADLVTWPVDYRLGLMQGLWFDLQDHPTVTPESIRKGLEVLKWVPDAGPLLQDLVSRVTSATPTGFTAVDWTVASSTVEFVKAVAQNRSEGEAAQLSRLAQHLEPPPPF